MSKQLEQHRELLLASFREACGLNMGRDVDDVHYYPEYRDRIVDFQREVLGVRPWAAARYVSESLIKYRRVALRSSRKTSKTHNAAGIVAAFMCTGPCIVVTTAPTGVQVRNYLWGEIRAQMSQSRRPLPGKCGMQAWRIKPQWYAFGFSTDDPNNALGFHAGVEAEGDWDDDAEELAASDRQENVPALKPEDIEKAAWHADREGRRLLVVIDEAPGVDQAVYEAMSGSLSGPETYVLVQGNPVIEADSPHFFAKIHQPGSPWHRIHISQLEIEEGEDEIGADACFHHPPRALRDQQWIEGALHEHGRQGPFFRAHALGLFVGQGDAEQRVISRALLESAEARGGVRAMPVGKGGNHMGVDVSRAGGDECVASLWSDGIKVAQHSWREPDLMKTAEIIVTCAQRWKVPAHQVHVDATGLGAGPLDRLRQMGWWVDGVDFGSGAVGDWRSLTGEMSFRNRRAELHWIYRRALQEGMAWLPRKWEQSWQQAQWPLFKMLAEGGAGTRIQIQPKEEIKARYGRSPDHLDSDILAWSRSSQRKSIRVVRR